MSRFEKAFSRGPALVTFVTAGDGPTDAVLDALVEGGADEIALVNFSGCGGKDIFSVAEQLEVEL